MPVLASTRMFILISLVHPWLLLSSSSFFQSLGRIIFILSGMLFLASESSFCLWCLFFDWGCWPSNFIIKALLRVSGVNWAHYFLSVLADMIYLILRESALPPGFQVLLEIADWHLWCMVGLILGCICLLMLFRFLYDFVTFPNRLFSATIISSVIHNDNIKKMEEWQLLLTSIALLVLSPECFSVIL